MKKRNFRWQLALYDLLVLLAVDLLLLDLYMPEMSGVELLAELRRKGCNADAVFITAANDAPHIQDALRLGAVDYLIKPFRYERFEEADA